MKLFEFLTERPLTKKEKGKKEKYVKGMKSAKGDFENRYGKDAKSVMYATATKMAKKESVHEEVDLNDKMIGQPDKYYDEEQRREAYDDLQTALDGVRNDWEKESVIDGVCPECSGTSYMDGDYDNDEDSCYGWGNYGCDQGEMENASWVEIVKHDKRNAERQKAKDNYPGDDEVINQVANMVKNMDDPRDAVFQLQADYPNMGKAQRAGIVAKAMKKAGLTEDKDGGGLIDDVMGYLNTDVYNENTDVEINRLKKLSGIKTEGRPFYTDAPDQAGAAQMVKDARGKEFKLDTKRNVFVALDGEEAGLNTPLGQQLKKKRAQQLAKTTQSYQAKLKNSMYSEDSESDASESAVAKMIAKALGDENRWTEMSAAELYAELESQNTEMADMVKDVAKMIYGVQLSESIVYQEITLEDDQDFTEEFGILGYSIDENDMFEAEYQGRKVKLNKPMRGDVKKFKVYVRDPKTGNVKKVNFGHGGTSAKRPTMRIRKSNPKARKSFRARHNCDNPGPKTKARYWSCRKW